MIAIQADSSAKSFRIFIAVTYAFWIFVICSIAGLFIEETYHLIVFHEFQNRPGLLFGPFSPIYGIGGFMAFVLSRFLRTAPLPLSFLVFAMSGGATEFIASLILQNTFGILAWDYTGTFLSIDGRTNAYFMCIWGVLGVLCMRFLVPTFNRLFALIVKYVPLWINKVFIAFMAVNVVLTLVSFNCWFHRLDGDEPESFVQIACADVFNNEFMESRFQAMSLYPQDALRD